MQRCDLEQRADLLLHLLGHEGALGEELAAVRHAVSHGLHLVERGDHAVLGVGQGVEHQTDAGRVVGNGPVQFEAVLAHGLVREVALRQTDALDQTFGEQVAAGGLHVDHLVFDRRAAAVEY